jgi:hypothetical protein
VADLNFGIAPMDLADALYNAVELSKETPGQPGCPHVLICYQADAESGLGTVLVYGVSRIVGGRTTLRLDTVGPEDHVSVAIGRDHANEIQSALRGYGRAKSARVGVRLSDEGFDVVEEDEDGEWEVRTINLSVQKEGQEPLAELADSDPGGEFSRHFDLVDDYVLPSGGQLAGPTAFSFEGIKRVTALKGLEAKALDLAQTTCAHVVAISAGPNFRGILGALDREVYAGPDGARASHLL